MKSFFQNIKHFMNPHKPSSNDMLMALDSYLNAQKDKTTKKTWNHIIRILHPSQVLY